MKGEKETPFTRKRPIDDRMKGVKGMKDTKELIIRRMPRFPFFNIAAYVPVDDVTEIIPTLIRALSKPKSLFKFLLETILLSS